MFTVVLRHTTLSHINLFVCVFPQPGEEEEEEEERRRVTALREDVLWQTISDSRLEGPVSGHPEPGGRLLTALYLDQNIKTTTFSLLW